MRPIDYARNLLIIVALAVGITALVQSLPHGPAPQANGSTGVVKALAAGNAAQVGRSLKVAASTNDSALACSLQTDADVTPITGPQPIHWASSHGLSCLWDGTTSVGADILAMAPAGDPNALTSAYQEQLRFSRHWAKISPTLGETVSEVPGMLDTYMITDTTVHALAVVTVRPDLGLVIRYTTPHDTQQNREDLFALAA